MRYEFVLLPPLYVNYVIPHPLPISPPLFHPSRPYIALSLTPNPSQLIPNSVYFDSQYGHTYGRRMMQGTLRYQLQQGSRRFEISQRQISSMLKKVAPSAHDERAHDLLDRTNPVPYYAPYFGYKLHMDQNEKLAQEFGVTHVRMVRVILRVILFCMAVVG